MTCLTCLTCVTCVLVRYRPACAQRRPGWWQASNQRRPMTRSSTPGTFPQTRRDRKQTKSFSYLSPSPRAMMPRRISVVPPWMVSLGAIMVA
jgi:hypothetical protein